MKGYKTLVSNIVMFFVAKHPEVQEFLGPDGVVAIITIINLGLRCLTTTPVLNKN